jgi:hypothetical protein
MFLAVEKVSEWRARRTATVATGAIAGREKHQIVRNIGLAAIILGTFVFASR